MADNAYYVPGAPEDLRKDHIVRAEGLGGLVKCLCVSTKTVCETARVMHQMSPAATAALGRFMTGSILISESMKNPGDTQTTIIRGDGPMEGMTCVTDFGFKVRAYPMEPVVPTEYHKPGKINVGAAVGKGSLTVVRDIGLKEPYVGVSELVSGEIAEDFAYYLAKSEQTKSIVSLGVLLEKGEVSHAGGLMVQLLPGAGEDEISYLEKRAAGFPEISFLFSEGFTPAQIIDLFMGDPDLKYLDGKEVEFKCNCSRERMLSGLAALGKKDLEEITKDGKPIETVCRFCNSKYVFEPDELKNV
ncbi:MAG: Hsp33 family molecular chaperone HslO [Clostridiales bacterium]|nr:Hsp33 family molecular chaperone HslO [Clostridiales bacterium]